MTETPMMKQFRDIKAQYPDALLLFRCGDFYETYFEDAVRASEILQITLTHRSNGANGSVPIDMAGFPFHALDTYLPKLVRQGLRVAICDQLEDPKLTKKLVKRGVTELVTPGVSYSENTIPQRENNFLACLHFPTKPQASSAIGLALLDISTGEFAAAEGESDYIDRLLTNFAPKEVLFMRGKQDLFTSLFGSRYYTFPLEDWIFTPQAATERLCRQFAVTSLKGFGMDNMPLAIVAAGGILHYLDITQHLLTGHIQHLSRIEPDRYVWLDRFTTRALELFTASAEGGKSLLDVLDLTRSPMGSRLLRHWITFPLQWRRAIEQRHSVVQFFLDHPEQRAFCQERMGAMQDIERITSKIATSRISPREMQVLRYALEYIDDLCNQLNSQLKTDNDHLSTLLASLAHLPELHNRIATTLVPEPPAVAGRPGAIADGVDEELDRLRQMHKSSRDYLLQLQQREAESTGISSLKIGYTNVFGYYLEVRNTYRDQVPETWIRKQTLVSAERYITRELKEYEEQINSAEEHIAIIETRIYQDLLSYLLTYVQPLQINASVLAQIDCLMAFAEAADRYHYTCPVMTDDLTIDLQGSRHPVIERQLPVGEEYVPNDILLDNADQQIIMLTGPNMAGKSALLRQTALTVLMAQMGSFVPASKAQIGWVDKVFTRVGASDNISAGESTFMVEMTEAAAILNNISERSLILFDELGRGTSTFDGISIAWAIVEYIHSHAGHPKTLFATHYHELNLMEQSFPRVRNYNVSVLERDGKIIFLRRLARGGSEHSFGIHVAQLAGLPKSIIQRSEQVLHDLEKGSARSTNGSAKGAISSEANGSGTTTISSAKGAISAPEGYQLSLFQLDDPLLSDIREEIANIDINALTPLEALNRLSHIQSLLRGK
ncbi:MAG: DNA mismatch repair protein MutS [Bacteroidales bacterium]|nr:DNA mismatch repair protein MutS [Candidatus Colicola coprequi]